MLGYDLHRHVQAKGITLCLNVSMQSPTPRQLSVGCLWELFLLNSDAKKRFHKHPTPLTGGTSASPRGLTYPFYIFQGVNMYAATSHFQPNFSSKNHQIFIKNFIKILPKIYQNFHQNFIKCICLHSP